MKPWKFSDPKSRHEQSFTHFKERITQTRLVIIDSEIHQMSGRYNGKAVVDDGEVIWIKNLIGFAEEHNVRW